MRALCVNPECQLCPEYMQEPSTPPLASISATHAVPSHHPQCRCRAATSALRARARATRLGPGTCLSASSTRALATTTAFDLHNSFAQQVQVLQMLCGDVASRLRHLTNTSIFTARHSQVLECEYGTWGAGGNLDVCNLCGEHYNTTANGAVPTTAALTGASSASQCAIAAGWSYVVPSDASQGLTPCNRGFYKDLIGNTTCTQCPNATTTTIMVAATELSDCNACRPGFGVPSGSIASLSAPSCGICTSGTYSSGYFTGGQACLPCPKPSLFTGRMVSRQVRGWLSVVLVASARHLAPLPNMFARVRCPPGNCGQRATCQRTVCLPPLHPFAGHRHARGLRARVPHRRRLCWLPALGHHPLGEPDRAGAHLRL